MEGKDFYQPERLERDALDTLFQALVSRGYQLVGPVRRESAILYDSVEQSSDLPIGYTDMQEGGSYRLIKRDDKAVFGYNVGPHSWKQFLYPPKQKLWQATRNNQGFSIEKEVVDVPHYAFIGVRACELRAMQIQDRILVDGEYTDPDYTRRRKQAFIVAVNCGQAANTCFCSAISDGPKAKSGFDLSLTEIINKTEHFFIIEAGSDKGVDILNTLPLGTASEQDREMADEAVRNAEAQMAMHPDLHDIHELLLSQYDNAQWDTLAKRCLACGNCTMVCPTCFCSDVTDTTDLTGDHAERWRNWASCFTMDFSYIHGGSIRPSTRARYRQWLMHKLATWVEQFGSSGCVGCGRCITWCPVGIDLREEVAAIRQREKENAA